MAEVFTRLKAFDAPQKDTFGHAKPIEIYHDDEGIQHAYELVHFYKFHVQAVEELIHRHEDLERRYKESENSRNALATKLHNTEIELKGVKADLEESKENLRREKKAHEKTKADLREAKEDLKKEIVSHQKTTVALEKSTEALHKEQVAHQRTKEMLEESKDELKREKFLHQTTKDKLKTSEEQLTKVKGELEENKHILTQTQSDLARTRSELCKARENYASADKRAEENRRQRDEAICNEKAANIRAREANDRADRLEEERDMLNKEVDNLKKALEKANASNNDSCTGLHVIRKPNHTCGNVYIDEIIYGGKAFNDKKTIDTFLQLLRNKTLFEVHNRLFPEDPWHLNLKTLTVVYSVDGKPFQYLIGKEWEKVRFTY